MSPSSGYKVDGLALAPPPASSGQWTRLAPHALVALACLSCGGGAAPDASGSARHVGSVTGSALTATSADSAAYEYDGAGNLLSVGGVRTSPVVVTGFAPAQGGVGQVVTVFGSGFEPAPALNTVTLGGVPVALLSVTANELTFAVPAGAVSGQIAVTSNGRTATSSAGFRVVPQTLVSGFSPAVGKAGDLVTITGANFDPRPAFNIVRIGGGSATVTSASSGALVVRVDGSATSGKVAVSAPSGTATSAEDFFILPPGFSPFDVEVTARLAGDQATAVAVTTPTKTALILFDGAQGQHTSLYLSGITFGSIQVTVRTPGGASLFATTVWGTQAAKLTLPALPESGTYSVTMRPENGGTGSAQVRLYQDATAALAPGGSPGDLMLQPGQNGRYSFSGNGGDRLSLGITTLSLTGARNGDYVLVTVTSPDGATLLWGGPVYAPTSFQLPPLPMTGSYMATVEPSGPFGATMTALLSRPGTGVVLVNGDPIAFANPVAGQSARYTFAGHAGDRLGLGVATWTSTPSNGILRVDLYRPNGAYIATNYFREPDSWQLPVLPEDGAYTLAVIPMDTASISATLLLSTSITGVLAPDGSVTAFETARVGQTGQFTFEGVAADLIRAREC